MARIRSTHPGQWTDEDFVTCSPLARLLCIALRNEADDKGVFEWKPITLKMRLLPADSVDVPELLEELTSAKQVKRFEFDGSSYGAIRNFRKYQRPKKPNDVFPLPDEFRTYVGLKDQSSEPMGKSGEQMEEGGGKVEEEKKGSCSVEADTNDNPEGPSLEDLPFLAELEPRGEVDLLNNPKSLDKRKLDTDEFESWWKNYPRKTSKGQARKAFKAARKKALLQTLIDGVERYVRNIEASQTEGQFIKHPSTWLNGECWADEDVGSGGQDGGEAQSPYQIALAEWFAAEEAAKAAGTSPPPKPNRAHFIDTRSQA